MYALNYLSLFHAVSASVALMVAVEVWRRRPAVGALSLAFTMAGIAFWSFCVAWEAAATTAVLKTIWAKVEYAAAMWVPLGFFFFSVEYSRNTHLLSRWGVALVAAFPVLTVALAATNEWHHLVWTKVELVPGRTYVAIFHYGPWIWVTIASIYGILVAGLGMVLATALHASALYRRQAGIIAAALILPFLGNVLYVFKLTPLAGVDLTPTAFLSSGLLVAVGLYRYQMLHIMPVARRRVVETMRDGVLVIDRQGRVADVNPAMAALLSMSPAQAIGQYQEDALGAFPALVKGTELAGHASAEVSLGTGGEARHFELTCTAMTDARGGESAKLLIAREITQRKKLEGERERLIGDLREALEEVRNLSGLLPICASCKRIRDDEGHWHNVENYIRSHTEAEFTHGICPECAATLYKGRAIPPGGPSQQTPSTPEQS